MSTRTSGVAKSGRKRIADGCEPQSCYTERIARRDAKSRGCERQYACPFMARDPMRSRCLKGYSNISRVKEHLRRRHVPSTASVLCPRCFTEFKDPAERWEHFRNVTPCELSTEPPANYRDRISKETNDALNRRTKRRESPEESWRHIYQMIYPDTSEEDIPSPFLDLLSESYRSECTTTTATEELPHHLRQSLSNTFKALDPSLQEAFAQIVQDNERIRKRREVSRVESRLPEADYSWLSHCRQSYSSDDQSTSVSDCTSLSGTVTTSTASELSTYDLPARVPSFFDMDPPIPSVPTSINLDDSSLQPYWLGPDYYVDPSLLMPSKQYTELSESTEASFPSFFADTGLESGSISLPTVDVSSTSSHYSDVMLSVKCFPRPRPAPFDACKSSTRGKTY